MLDTTVSVCQHKKGGRILIQNVLMGNPVGSPLFSFSENPFLLHPPPVGNLIPIRYVLTLGLAHNHKTPPAIPLTAIIHKVQLK